MSAPPKQQPWGLWLALVLVVALAGAALGATIVSQRVFPYWEVRAGWAMVQDMRHHWPTYFGRKPTKFFQPARHGGSGVTMFEPTKSQPGVTFITGLYKDQVSLWLVDNDGRLRWHWPVSYGAIWPNPQHITGKPVPFGDWLTHIHGAALLKNGDVIFNFEGLGLVRLDKCGEVVWKLRRMTHHAVVEDEDGTLWVPARRYHASPQTRLPRIEPPFWEDTVLHLRPNGEVIEEISILQALYDDRHLGRLFATGESAVTVRRRKIKLDVTHLNDVEPLPSALADAFPMFNAGDLLVSLRNTNLVAVIDRRSHRIKWAENGAWLRQHDPDFMTDGRIMVFDNRKDDANGRVFGGSRILAIDPADGQVEVLFEGTEKAPFYTNVMGQQQRQPNGNLLISEPQAGRAIEVTPAGKIVWQYVNGYTPGINALMEMAFRYPLAYGEFADTPCP